MSRSLWFIWGLGLSVALLLAGWRWQIEEGYRTVAIIVDGLEVQQLAAWTGLSVKTVLRGLREAGVTGVSVPPVSLTDLLARGEVRVVRRDGQVWLVSDDRKVLGWVRDSFREQWGLILSLSREGAMWRLPLVHPILLHSHAPLFLGLSRSISETAKEINLLRIARIPNPLGLTERGVSFWLREAEKVKAFALVFEGEEVLGYRDLLPSVTRRLQGMGLHIGVIELTRQKGIETLARLLPDRIIRVHSISLKELFRYTPSTAVSRFLRAVSERNIRLCYLRFFPRQRGDPFMNALHYIDALKGRLQRQGFKLGVPSRLPPLTAPFPLWAFVWFGVVAVGIAFVTCFIPLTPKRQWGLFILGAPFGLGLHWIDPIWAAKLSAFGLALTAPVVALWIGHRFVLFSYPRLQRMALGLAVCLGFLFGCGIMEAALFFDHRFWLKVEQFIGVKASQLLPFLFVLAMTFSHWWDTGELSFRDRQSLAVSAFRGIWESPIRWGQFFLSLFAFSVVVYWLLRTGNIAGFAPLTLEVKLREFLGESLGVRPRFKEFLLGHPSLVLAFYFLTGTQLEARIGQWLFVPSVIGLASIMNTFSHTHTPIAVSVLRTAHGVWLGLFLGVILIGVMKWSARQRDRRLLQTLWRG